MWSFYGKQIILGFLVCILTIVCSPFMSWKWFMIFKFKSWPLFIFFNDMWRWFMIFELKFKPLSTILLWHGDDSWFLSWNSNHCLQSFCVMVIDSWVKSWSLFVVILLCSTWRWLQISKFESQPLSIVLLWCGDDS